MKKLNLKPNSIVKVQVPLYSNVPVPAAMVYNKSRTYHVYMSINKVLEKAMQGEPKKFFYASYDAKTNNTVLNGEAPWQDW